MTATPATSRTQLAKLLAVLGLDNLAECDAADPTFGELAVQPALSWQHTIKTLPVENALLKLGTWRALVAECLARAGSRRPWEVGCLRDLPVSWRRSVEQRYMPNEIGNWALQGRQA
ncbi:MAG: hypothetical protein P4L90_01430 [Rhodopila sp.]|nr:hypothetical protein [Rhodopila sp.]